MNNVIDFTKYRANKNAQSYSFQLQQMDKLSLLNEMAKFMERKDEPQPLSIQECIDGIALFRILATKAETDELREMAKKCFNELSMEYQNAHSVV